MAHLVNGPSQKLKNDHRMKTILTIAAPKMHLSISTIVFFAFSRVNDEQFPRIINEQFSTFRIRIFSSSFFVSYSSFWKYHFEVGTPPPCRSPKTNLIFDININRLDFQSGLSFIDLGLTDRINLRLNWFGFSWLFRLFL